MRYKIVVFSDVHEAMAFEEEALDSNLKGRLIPLPSIIASGCGMSWREPADNEIALIQYLKDKEYQKLVDMDM